MNVFAAAGKKLLGSMKMAVIAMVLGLPLVLMGGGAAYVMHDYIDTYVPKKYDWVKFESEGVVEADEILALAVMSDRSVEQFDYPDALMETLREDVLFIVIVRIHEGEGAAAANSQLLLAAPDNIMMVLSLRLKGAKSYSIEVNRIWKEPEPEPDPESSSSATPQTDEF